MSKWYEKTLDKLPFNEWLAINYGYGGVDDLTDDDYDMLHAEWEAEYSEK